MATKRPFTPGFINKLDGHLLKNNPVTWSTRIHLALYYGFAFSAVLVLICFIVPDDPRNQSAIYNWITLLIIISILSFVIWMIYLLRFNVFKRYGKWKKTDSGKTFIFYFIIVCMIVSWPFIPPIVQSIRANMAYSAMEIQKDINSMNVKLCQLERDSISTKFSRDTLKLLDSMEVSRRNVLPESNDDLTLVYTTILNERLRSADSVMRINDSVYVVYACPDYQFVTGYIYPEAGTPQLMTSMELYNQVLTRNEKVDQLKIRAELDVLFDKYRRPDVGNQWFDGIDYSPEMGYPSYSNKINAKYQLSIINGSINNIIQKKYRWDDTTIKFSYHLLYYIVLVLVLLVTIYRHTTRRTFFLSVLVAVILSILTGLFLAMSLFSGSALFTWVEVYFVLFALICITIWYSSHRSVVSGIALNLLVFITPFMPLVLTATYYSILQNMYDDRLEEKAYLFRNEELHYIYAEVLGFVLLFVMLLTVYQVAYRKWYALPQQ